MIAGGAPLALLRGDEREVAVVVRDVGMAAPETGKAQLQGLLGESASHFEIARPAIEVAEVGKPQGRVQLIAGPLCCLDSVLEARFRFASPSELQLSKSVRRQGLSHA